MTAGDGQDKPPKPRFTISKETTYVTEPVDKHGYINYATALNKRLSKGVTPENNANVLLWRAFGPNPEGATMPKEFFQWMGIEPLPDQGDYVVDYVNYIQRHLKAVTMGTARARAAPRTATAMCLAPRIITLATTPCPP